MLGMKKRTPAGHAAVGIILTAALLLQVDAGQIHRIRQRDQRCRNRPLN